MTNDRLSQAYLQKAQVRIQALHFLHEKKGYSDVIREAQECVELLLKALLRQLGLEVPKVHDVSRLLREKQNLMPEPIKSKIDEVATISRTLRKERELAFYGSDDWIPTEEYGDKDSSEAIQQAEIVFDLVSKSLDF